jgi:hypothetical protein
MWVWLVVAGLVLALIFGRTSKESFYIENDISQGIKYIRIVNTPYHPNHDSVDTVPMWQGTPVNLPGLPQGQDEYKCRMIAQQNTDLYDAWGFRSNNHGDPRYKNTCFFIQKGTMGSFKGGNADGVHVTGCAFPGEKMANRCEYIGDVNGNRYIQISHLDAFNMNGTNVSANRRVDASPPYGGGQAASSVVTGSSTVNNWPNIYHSLTCRGNEFWQVTLDNPETLSKIVFYNRGDCCQDRALNYVLHLYDATGQIISMSPFTASSKIITFYINKLVGAAPPGPQGPQGIPGTAANKGDPGPAGPTGAKGDVGSTGSQGPQGTVGANGAAGPTGPTGPTGSIGKDGIPGPEGKQGVPGPYGLRGDVGPTGGIGPKGPKGDQGPMGMDALEEGADGTYARTTLGSAKYPTV